MKTKEIKDLQTKTMVELKKLLKDAATNLVTLKLDHQQSKLSNTRSIFNVRKQIAIIKTIMKVKEVVNG
ncbi:MAG TPA: 50S ribosomal protein L29 [Patescibacteria group bacterium]